MQRAMKRIYEKLKKGENALIMAVGDSITHGENHCTSEETYCAELARLMGRRFPKNTILRYDGIMQAGAMPLKGYDYPVTVQSGTGGVLTIVRNGVGGDSVRRALRRSQDYAGKFFTGEWPDVFLIMFGINDALAGDSAKFVSPDVFYADLKELSDLLAHTNPGAEIVFMTPTYNDSGKNRSSCLDPYAEKMKRLAEKNSFQLIDTHAFWMEHLIPGSEHFGQRDWLSDAAGDSCHFSPLGSRETARFIFHELNRI